MTCAFSMTGSCCCHDKKMINSGIRPSFQMPGYHVWCGSVIKDRDGKYQMFASRWKQEKTFHAWKSHSQVVRAQCDTPWGPFEFQEVVFEKRGLEYWDACCTHCPVVYQYGDKYFMLYTGMRYALEDTPENFPAIQIVAHDSKQLGIAVADDLKGPWKRFDAPAIPKCPGTFYDAITTDPTAVVRKDGSILVIFKSRRYVGPDYVDPLVPHRKFAWPYRSGQMCGAAIAPSLGEPFKVVTPVPLFGAPDSLYPEIEDPCIWLDEKGTYHMLAKDMLGKICGEENQGCHFVATNGLDWRYDDIAYTTVTDEYPFSLRERPWILLEDGKPLALYNAVGEAYPYRMTMKDKPTYNIVAPVPEGMFD